MAKSERIVVQEIPAGGAKRIDFAVEYKDAKGHWVAADGGWNWGLAVRSSYPNEAAALSIAREIAKQAQYATRVVKVVTDGD